jgi:hypothetical protein
MVASYTTDECKKTTQHMIFVGSRDNFGFEAAAASSRRGLCYLQLQPLSRCWGVRARLPSSPASSRYHSDPEHHLSDSLPSSTLLLTPSITLIDSN